MRKLTAFQLERASEVLENVAVAWFTAVVISPFFIKPKNWLEVISFFVLGLIMAGLFFVWSLILAGRIKS